MIAGYVATFTLTLTVEVNYFESFDNVNTFRAAGPLNGLTKTLVRNGLNYEQHHGPNIVLNQDSLICAVIFFNYLW